jgi:hypothetical protein
MEKGSQTVSQHSFMTKDGRTLIGKKRLEGHETESLVMGSGKKEKRKRKGARSGFCKD